MARNGKNHDQSQDKETDMERHLDILKKQEEILRFKRFDNESAFELGCFMMKRAKELSLQVALSIRSADGAVLFQYLCNDATALNDNWLRRKTNTVIMMGASSLRGTYNLEGNGESIEDNGLSKEDYALCGGGFPVRLEGMDHVIGAVCCSNMYHIADHEFVVDRLREYLNRPEAPSYPYTLP